MRAVVQRVLSADVSVAGKIVGSIDGGFLVYLGVGEGDAKKDADYLADKIVNLRVFEDGQGKMNQSLLDTGGKLLIISQFTLYGDCRKGRRPSFSGSAPAQEAKRLFDYFVEVIVESWDVQIEKGVFQENMMVRSVNDGPVTILLDSSKLF